MSIFNHSYMKIYVIREGAKSEGKGKIEEASAKYCIQDGDICMINLMNG